MFITAGLTYAAHRIVLAARRPRAGTTGHARGTAGPDGEDTAMNALLIPLATDIDWVALAVLVPAVRGRHRARLHGLPVQEG